MSEKKVWLVDNEYSSDEKDAGHNYKYCKSINKIEDTCIYERKQKFCFGTFRYIQACKERYDYLRPVLTGNSIHILVLDFFYKYPHVFKKISGDNAILGTLHRVPSNEIDFLFLKRTAKYLQTIIVHSEFMKDVLLSHGISNVDVVEYPAFFNEKFLIQEREKKFTFLALGGTRYEKGADILIEAAGKMPSDIKRETNIRIAGEEKDIKYKELKKNAIRENVNIETVENRLTEEKYWMEIQNASVVICPYRRSFLGASGPMTDAVFFAKPVIGPDYGNLGDWIHKKKVGLCFEVENAEDLSQKMQEIYLNYEEVKNTLQLYPDYLSEKRFVEKHREIYKKYIKDNT